MGPSHLRAIRPLGCHSFGQPMASQPGLARRRASPSASFETSWMDINIIFFNVFMWSYHM